ncbi:MAG: hypothetical protein WC457_04355 [Patescibacteria group bacterium]
MINRFAKISLIILGYLIILSAVANIFDADLGWHLRCGRDTFASAFPYLDTYTYSYYGQPWTNHEWGGDVLFWAIYSMFGYFTLPILVAACVWFTLLGAIKIFFGQLSMAGIIAGIVGAGAVSYLLAPRLAFIVPALLVCLLFTLEKKKYLFLWPMIIWLWSALHGSWILGFIIINIYLFGNLASIILQKYFPKFASQYSDWRKKDFTRIIFWQIISAAAVCLNPYGWKIWQEVGQYLSPQYFKLVVNEWLPSYVFPIYPWPLVIGAVAAVLLAIAYYKKRATLAQLLLFFAMFFAAWQAKRQAFYLVVVSLPIIALAAETSTEEIKTIFFSEKNINRAKIIIIILATCGCIFALTKIHFTNDIWSDKEFLTQRELPFGAVAFIKTDSNNKKINIFNEFRWGGYLNWSLPNALVYFDGRGTATWRDEYGKTYLQKYREIKMEAGGLKILNSSKADYVLLSRSTSSVYPRPDWLNRMIFGENELQKVFSTDESQLEKMLKISADWKLIYSDNIARVWKKQLVRE